MGIIKHFSDGSFLEYDYGRFDEWCVYLSGPSQERKPPRDVDYFKQMTDLALIYGNKKLYEDFTCVYCMTNRDVESNVLKSITDIASFYGEDALNIDILFSVLYMAMIAEERKAGTRLGKRIKRLGIYYLLFEGATIEKAANFMRGMKWREIAALCEQRGF